MSRWERVELELATLFSTFEGTPRDDACIKAFGAKNRIFRDRLRSAEDAAKAYFVKHPNQDHEGEFRAICADLLKQSDIRNNIAHSIVYPVTFKDQGTTAYQLRTPWYAYDKLSIKKQSGWCSNEIAQISNGFRPLAQRIRDLNIGLGGMPALYRTPFWQ